MRSFRIAKPSLPHTNSTDHHVCVFKLRQVSRIEKTLLAPQNHAKDPKPQIRLNSQIGESIIDQRSHEHEVRCYSAKSHERSHRMKNS